MKMRLAVISPLRPDGTIAKSNATLSAWIGFTAEQLAKKRFLDLLNIAGRIFWRSSFRAAVAHAGFLQRGRPGPRYGIGCAISRFGRMRSSSATPPATILFIRVTIFNAAERRRYERGLVAAKEEAQLGLSQEREVAQLREQFIAGVGP